MKYLSRIGDDEREYTFERREDILIARSGDRDSVVDPAIPIEVAAGVEPSRLVICHGASVRPAPTRASVLEDRPPAIGNEEGVVGDR